jgi:hypothetical protein
MALVERWRGLWDDIRRNRTRLPARIAVPPGHVARGQDDPNEDFRADEHYFVVRVNELYLTYDRDWFVKYDPMVLVVTEFTYDDQEHAVPFVVGPSLLGQHGTEAPAGMVFSDTRVAGIHPYRGGRLTLSVVLSRVQRENYATKLLEVVESTAGVLDFATALGVYVKVAGVVLDGVQALFGLDNGAQPLLGHRKEFEPDAGDTLAPGYFALIDVPEEQLDPGRLWVRDRQLRIGETLETSSPFREADYVLYSILQADRRGDERLLPFYSIVERMRREATSRAKDDWELAKADMTYLWQALVLSPDLTGQQASDLRTHYVAELKDLLGKSKEMADELSTLGRGDGKEPDPTVAELRNGARILEL